jgi:phospholipase/lecithinase/hemolysin
MKTCFHLLVCGLWVWSGAAALRAEFTSLYVFGDGASTTTGQNSSFPQFYYGKRFCNGRVWTEVLAQWQKLAYTTNKEIAYYGQDSAEMLANVKAFVPPPDVSSALFVIWVNNADLVEILQDGSYGPPFGANVLPLWTNTLHRSLTNHAAAITNLHGKGARTLLMPNAVDMNKVPFFAAYNAGDEAFLRQRIMEYNTNFAALLSNAVATLPGLRIVPPDISGLLNNIHANSTNYGLIAPPNSDSDYALYSTYFEGDTSLTLSNAPYSDFVFWDDLHPTAKFQMHIANAAQQALSPAIIASISSGPGASNQLTLAQLPVGKGFNVEASTNFTTWTSVATTTATNLSQSLAVPAPNEAGFYRLRLPFVWTWP